MKRTTAEYTDLLTFRDIPADKRELNRQIKSMLNALRDMAKRQEWSYQIHLAPSTTDPRTGEKVRLHIHVIIIGNPACTIAAYVSQYWRKRHGNSSYQRMISGTACHYRTHYVDAQADKIYEQEYDYAMIESSAESFSKSLESRQGLVVAEQNNNTEQVEKAAHAETEQAAGKAFSGKLISATKSVFMRVCGLKELSPCLYINNCIKNYEYRMEQHGNRLIELFRGGGIKRLRIMPILNTA